MKIILFTLLLFTLLAELALPQEKDPNLTWEGDIGYLEIKDSGFTNDRGITLTEVYICLPKVINGYFIKTYLGVIDHKTKILVTDHSDIFTSNLYLLNGKKATASALVKDGEYLYCVELIIVLQESL